MTGARKESDCREVGVFFGNDKLPLNRFHGLLALHNEILDARARKKYNLLNVAGGFPSAKGKT